MYVRDCVRSGGGGGGGDEEAAWWGEWLFT